MIVEKYKIVKLSKGWYTIHEFISYPSEKLLFIILKKAYKQWEQSGWYGPNWDEYSSDFRPYYFKSKKEAKKTINKLRGIQKSLEIL